jgi:hypothetical protein
MKNKIGTYETPRVEEYELTVENGIAQSGAAPLGSPSGISEYTEDDMSGDASFWQ